MSGKTDTILVTGANGFIGAALCVRLQQDGIQVREAVRTAPVNAGSISSAVAIGDICSVRDFVPVVSGCACVVHLAGRAHMFDGDRSARSYYETNVSATLSLAQAAVARGSKRFVFVSSAGVLGKKADRVLTEIDPPAPYNAYTASKLEAERRLQDLSEKSGLEVVIVRPAMVYGPGCPGNLRRLSRLIARRIPLPLSRVRNHRSLVGLSGLANLLAHAARMPGLGGEVFLAADRQSLSTPQIVESLAKGLDVSPRLFAFPSSGLRLAGMLSGRADAVSSLIDSHQIDASKAEKRLGLHLASDTAEALVAVGRSFRVLAGARSTNVPASD